MNITQRVSSETQLGSCFEVTMYVAPDYPFDIAAHSILEGLRHTAARFVEENTPEGKQWSWEELPAKEDPMYGPPVGYRTLLAGPADFPPPPDMETKLEGPVVVCILAGRIIEATVEASQRGEG